MKKLPATPQGRAIRPTLINGAILCMTLLDELFNAIALVMSSLGTVLTIIACLTGWLRAASRPSRKVKTSGCQTGIFSGCKYTSRPKKKAVTTSPSWAARNSLFPVQPVYGHSGQRAHHQNRQRTNS